MTPGAAEVLRLAKEIAQPSSETVDEHEQMAEEPNRHDDEEVIDPSEEVISQENKRIHTNQESTDPNAVEHLIDTLEDAIHDLISRVEDHDTTKALQEWKLVCLTFRNWLTASNKTTAVLEIEIERRDGLIQILEKQIMALKLKYKKSENVGDAQGALIRSLEEAITMLQRQDRHWQNLEGIHLKLIANLEKLLAKQDDEIVLHKARILDLGSELKELRTQMPDGE